MNKIVGITGSGIIGRDPWDPHCWSYSGFNLFTSMKKAGVLRDAFGVEATRLEYIFAAAKNFHYNKSIWRKRLNLDPWYYKALTRAVSQQINKYGNDNDFFQLGAIYDGPSVLNGRARCFSYHDGNIAQMMTSPNFPTHLLSRAKKAFKWEKRVYDGIDKIFTMSEYLRQSFINDFDLSPNKVVNVGVGANFEIPELNPNKDLSKRGILYIGADYTRKGLINLVTAFRAVRHIHLNATLHIIGPREVPKFLKDDLEGIYFHGFLSRDNQNQRAKFMSILDECTLFILPSLYEPFGIVVLEAMACGMAAIATNRWAFPEMITPGRSGDLVEPNNVEDLINKIEMYFNDNELRILHGRNARNDVIKRISWDNVVSHIATEINNEGPSTR